MIWFFFANQPLLFLLNKQLKLNQYELYYQPINQLTIGSPLDSSVSSAVDLKKSSDSNGVGLFNGDSDGCVVGIVEGF